MKTVYLYDQDSGAYLREYEAQENPMVSGSFIQPTHSTDFPPTIEGGTWPVWQGGNWVNVPDHRGAVWDVNTGLSVEHAELGELPGHLTGIQKPSGFYEWSGGAWVFDLEAARAAKAIEIKQAASAAIVAGIASEVLGDIHTYPTGVIDQANLNGLVTESLLPDAGDDYKFWCADGLGVWARRAHTKIQIQMLGKAVANHVKTQQQHYENKLLELRAASTEQSVNFVAW